MTRRRFALGLLLAPVAVRPAGAQDSGFGAGRPEDRYFSVETHLAAGRRGPVAEGYVLNRYDHYATRVALTLLPVDASGRQLAPVTVYVFGVPPRSRTYFRAAVPAGTAGVQASVANFDWAPRGSGGAS
jgi:hypothetical protein